MTHALGDPACRRKSSNDPAENPVSGQEETLDTTASVRPPNIVTSDNAAQTVVTTALPNTAASKDSANPDTEQSRDSFVGQPRRLPGQWMCLVTRPSFSMEE